MPRMMPPNTAANSGSMVRGGTGWSSVVPIDMIRTEYRVEIANVFSDLLIPYNKKRKVEK